MPRNTQSKNTKKRQNRRSEDNEDVIPFDDEDTEMGYSEVGDHLIKNLPIYVSIFLLIFFVFSMSSLFGMAGNLGSKYFIFVTAKLGIFSYPLPLFYLYLAFLFIRRKHILIINPKFIAFIFLTSAVFLLISLFNLGGSVGDKIYSALSNNLGPVPTVFISILVSILSLAKMFETTLEDMILKKLSAKEEIKKIENEVEEEIEQLQENVVEAVKSEQNFFGRMFSNLFSSRPPENVVEVQHESPDDVDENEEDVGDSEDVRSAMYKAVSMDVVKEEKPIRVVQKTSNPDPVDTEDEEEQMEEVDEGSKKENREKLRQATKEYTRPPLSLYTQDSGKSSAGDNKENSRIIKRTLADFGISVEMDEVTVGPTVTRYALKPAQGVKIEKIINLGNNIALELGVSSVSITRIPERSLIGIEVPNKQKSKLGIGSLLSKKDFLERKDKLTMTLGKDIYGDPVFVDMARMPHLLVAGTTGSGKSALVHDMINSLVYKNSPYDLKFILIDPKKVEFSLYSQLPHLYTPIIKDPKKAVQTLNWLVQEMDRRYHILEENGKQNIGSYHEFVKQKYQKAAERGVESREKLPEKMPYIVLVIDELADFMMKYPKEMEAGIVKLAQMSRAVGIHLILATQRPSTNIITGVIKGNIPSRVALRVASQVDSRVIIDQGGAEKLLGYGDMLFLGSDGSDLKRIQSPFMQEDEIKDVVAFLRTKYDDVVTEELKTKENNIVGAQNISGGGGYSDADFSEEDDKYEDAKQVVLQTKKTSISNLQVRLGTGYARSAKLINMLEQAGVIISTTDASGKQVKVVAGQDVVNTQSNKSEALEAQAGELLKDEPEEVEEKDTGSSGGFFKF